MAKRAGRGNDSERNLAETRTGEMGISCIACPRPGVNLPEDWDKVAKGKRYVILHSRLRKANRYRIQLLVLAVHCG